MYSVNVKFTACTFYRRTVCIHRYRNSCTSRSLIDENDAYLDDVFGSKLQLKVKLWKINRNFTRK